MANFILTITGADDNVDPQELIRISAEYPWVEWGILFSNSNPDTPRYPSKEWRSSLYAELLSAQHITNLSAHLCGSYVKEFLFFDKITVNELNLFYRRIQFNNYSSLNQQAIWDYALNSTTPCILPMNARTKGLPDPDVYLQSRFSYLHDCSGGHGKEVITENWELPVQGANLTGYAGGVNENNIESHLQFLFKREGDKPFWIDLETGARTDNQFDLNKVKRILEKASAFQMPKNLGSSSKIILAT